MSRPTKNKPTEYTELEQDLLEAANAMLAHSRGEKIISENNYITPENINVKKIRSDLHLTQEQFASFIGSSVHAVRHWENGRRIPDGTARTLLQVLHHNPEAVLDALNSPHKGIM
jgi:putative transcriptional regulator